jgi:hypothetical protein
MAVGAQRRHVARMILAAFGQILDMVDIQDRLATPAGLGWQQGSGELVYEPVSVVERLC